MPADGPTLQNWSQATTYVVGANDGGLRIVRGERCATTHRCAGSHVRPERRGVVGRVSPVRRSRA